MSHCTLAKTASTAWYSLSYCVFFCVCSVVWGNVLSWGVEDNRGKTKDRWSAGGHLRDVVVVFSSMDGIYSGNLERSYRIESIHSSTLSSIHSFICSFIHSFIHAFIHSFIHSFIHCGICGYTCLCVCVHVCVCVSVRVQGSPGDPGAAGSPGEPGLKVSNVLFFPPSIDIPACLHLPPLFLCSFPKALFFFVFFCSHDNDCPFSCKHCQVPYRSQPVTHKPFTSFSLSYPLGYERRVRVSRFTRTNGTARVQRS